MRLARHTLSLAAIVPMLCAMTALTFAQSADDSDAGDSDQKRSKIFHGTVVPPGAYPFQVALIRANRKVGDEFNGQYCAGSMIADQWVLTAAHCVNSAGKPKSPSEVHIYVGSQNFKGGDRIEVADIIAHSGYNHRTHDNDIALLKLKRAPKAEVKYDKINLVDAGNEAKYGGVGRTVKVIGWGKMEDDKFPDSLLETDVKISDRGACNATYVQVRGILLADRLTHEFLLDKNKIEAVVKQVVAGAGKVVNDGMVCATGTKVKPDDESVRDSCQGDSGGPLFAMEAGKAYQVGVVSFGQGCGVQGIPGIYARVGKYADWIKRSMK